jgi:hypothetical protein
MFIHIYIGFIPPKYHIEGEPWGPKNGSSVIKSWLENYPAILFENFPRNIYGYGSKRGTSIIGWLILN